MINQDIYRLIGQLETEQEYLVVLDKLVERKEQILAAPMVARAYLEDGLVKPAPDYKGKKREEIPEWRDPEGKRTGAYVAGWLVQHDGRVWECVAPGLAMGAPGTVMGEWLDVTDKFEGTPAEDGTEPTWWEVGKQYKTGDLVLHAGNTYRVLTEHTATEDTVPADKPDLYEKQG